MPSGDSDEPFINFDPRFCRRIARVAAAACAVLVLCTVIILLTVDPSNTRCPGWRLVAKNGTSTSVWGFVVIQAVMAICISFIALNWRWFARRVIDKLTWADQTLRADDAKGGGFLGFFGIGGKLEAMGAVFSDTNAGFPVWCAAWVALCSIPLLVIAGKCA